MAMRRFSELTVLLPLALLLFAGCAEDEYAVPAPSGFPGFADSWVAVLGTVSHPGWSTGRFVFTVYPQGSPPTAGGGQRGGSTGGAASAQFVVGVPVGSGNVFILAFNDVDGSMTQGGSEWQACSGVLTIGSEDLFGIDLVLASSPPVCP